jgi:hypothetical protein
MVQVWDASTGHRMASFEEHEKRVWSVDSCRQDPTRLASGSDDLKGVCVGGGGRFSPAAVMPRRIGKRPEKSLP